MSLTWINNLMQAYQIYYRMNFTQVKQEEGRFGAYKNAYPLRVLTVWREVLCAKVQRRFSAGLL